MRITFGTQYKGTVSSLNKNLEQMYSLSDAMASGVRLTAPSDDPASWSKAMDLKQGLREYDSVLKNIDYATGWTETTDSALSDISDLLSQAHAAGVAAIGADGSEEPLALQEQLSTVIDNLMSAANTQYGDQYVFAGTNTGTVPYSIDDSGNVTYTGNSESRQVKTGRSGQTTTVNCTGTDVFEFESGGETLNLINEVWQLKKAISDGDTNAISEKLTTLEDAQTSVSGQNSVTGTRLSSLETKKSSIKLMQTDMKSWLSDAQDTDYTEATIQYSQATLAYQAALQVTSQLGNLSLLNYL